jgi:hypothetical protein
MSCQPGQFWPGFLLAAGAAPEFFLPVTFRVVCVFRDLTLNS